MLLKWHVHREPPHPTAMGTKTTGIQNWHIVVGENKFMKACKTFFSSWIRFFLVVALCLACGQIAGECTHSSHAYLAVLTCGGWAFVWLWLLLILHFYIPHSYNDRTFWFYVGVYTKTDCASAFFDGERIQFFATLPLYILYLFNIPTTQIFKLQKTRACCLKDWIFINGWYFLNRYWYSRLCYLDFFSVEG